MSQRPECFVIAPIGKEGDPIRARSDRILKFVIRPVAEELGYNAIRADELGEPGIITTQITNRILDAPTLLSKLADRRTLGHLNLNGIALAIEPNIGSGWREHQTVVALRAVQVAGRHLPCARISGQIS